MSTNLNKALLWVILNEESLLSTLEEAEYVKMLGASLVVGSIKEYLKTQGKVILHRKRGDQPHIDIGLFYLPNNPVTPYVTWIINTSRKESDGGEYTALGHYCKDYMEALRDYAERD